jgi:hypothetical protein
MSMSARRNRFFRCLAANHFLKGFAGHNAGQPKFFVDQFFIDNLGIPYRFGSLRNCLKINLTYLSLYNKLNA